VAIDRDLNLAVPARGNDRRGTLFLHCFANIDQNHNRDRPAGLGLGPPLPSRGQSRIIRDLACGDLGGYRQSFAVRAEVNFSREAPLERQDPDSAVPL